MWPDDGCHERPCDGVERVIYRHVSGLSLMSLHEKHQTGMLQSDSLGGCSGLGSEQVVFQARVAHDIHFS